MSLRLPRLSRTWMRTVAVVTVAALAYAAGLASGLLARPDGVHDAAGQRAGSASELEQTRDRIEQQALHAVSKDTLDRAAVQAMLDTLGDPWSAYYDSKEYETFSEGLDGHYSGVGLLLRQRRTGAVYVAAVQPGSPAARAHLGSGLVLVSVAGVPVSGHSAAEVAGLLRGPRGSSVTLAYKSGTKTRSVVLGREDLVSRDVTVDRLSSQVARITITSFTRGVGVQVKLAMQELSAEHVGGVVVDVRGNSGGLLDEAVRAASAFLDGGPVVAYERRGQPARTLTAAPGGDVNTPLAVLVDGGTASAAEVLAGALQDRGRAVVVGTRTFGKGTVQEPMHLDDGSVIEMTVARYRTPSGRWLDGVGLEPDIEVAPGSSRDVAEQRAVEALTGLLADAGTGGRG